MERSPGPVLGAIVFALALSLLAQPGCGRKENAGEAQPVAGTAGETRTETPVGAIPEARRHDAVRYDADGIAIGGIEPNPTGGIPLDIDNIIASHANDVVISRDGADTFTVPLPGDPEWADYLEFRRHYRSSLDATPGFVVAYDPEWRSMLEGKRVAPDPDFDLFGGDPTLRGLLQQVVDRLGESDEQGLVDLALRKEEFEIICWPSFPQSRPYLRYKWEEAWGFQYAGILGGIKEGIRDAGGRPLDLESVAYSGIRDFGNFRIYDDVTIGAVDRETGEHFDLDFVDSVIERNGVFKVFIYTD